MNDYLVRFRSVSEAVRYQGQVNQYYPASFFDDASYSIKLHGSGPKTFVPAKALRIFSSAIVAYAMKSLNVHDKDQLLNLPFIKVYGALGDSPDVTVTTSSSAPGLKSKSDGSTADYYELPKDDPKQLQDLISYRNMNGQVAEIFRACYRYGEVEHSEKLRDAKKMRFYADAEVKRLEKYGE